MHRKTRRKRTFSSFYSQQRIQVSIQDALKQQGAWQIEDDMRSLARHCDALDTDGALSFPKTKRTDGRTLL